MGTITALIESVYGKKITCQGSRPMWEQTTQIMYDGTQAHRPDLWCLILGHTALASAKSVIATAINNVAAGLDAGDLKTKMLAFDAADESTLTTLMTWAEPLRETGTPKLLHSALFAAAKFLKSENPDVAAITIDRILRYNIENNGTTRQVEVDTLYAFLKGEVDFTTWKGSYT